MGDGGREIWRRRDKRATGRRDRSGDVGSFVDPGREGAQERENVKNMLAAQGVELRWSSDGRDVRKGGGRPGEEVALKGREENEEEEEEEEEEARRRIDCSGREEPADGGW